MYKGLCMEDTIIVEYMWRNDKPNGDLVCDITRFMDNYLKNKRLLSYCKTYLYNDLGIFSTNNLTRIAFRYPGATRGSILLKRLSTKQFEIMGFQFNTDTCFSEQLGCYKLQLQQDIDEWIGKVLDFSKVTLVNNIYEFDE